MVGNEKVPQLPSFGKVNWLLIYMEDLRINPLKLNGRRIRELFYFQLQRHILKTIFLWIIF